ncbi:uncharacterized protein LOC134468257 [Engraulis encrasicolus]|uniref:uncharacterized protein LOC134468257 n=1 Tax=Engraulis encrasicolus TaxID=184585 RepID=UPI002FD5F1BD
MPKKKLKAFVIEHGQTLNSRQQFVEHLSKRLKEVTTEDHCDVMLAICPIVSGVGTDIEAAMKAFEDISPKKPIILVVLHHTFDRDYVVPDCSRYVGDSVELIVNGLFHEDHGLLKNCDVNTQAINQTLEKLMKLQKKRNPLENVKLPHMPFGIKRAKPKLKGFVIESGKTLDSGQQFVGRLSYRLEEVKAVDEYDIILGVCPIVSRVGTDIEAAMKVFEDKCPTTKHFILLVLHHTFDRDYVIPDCSRYVGDRVSFTVHALFHEDHGLLKNCDVNTKAINQTLEKLKEFQKENMKKDDQKQHKSPKTKLKMKKDKKKDETPPKTA